jgi:two-component system phosphate regulon response regulator PhoB
MELRVLVHSRDTQMFLLLQHILATEGFSASCLTDVEEIECNLADDRVKAVIVDCSTTKTCPPDLQFLKIGRRTILTVLLCSRHDHGLDGSAADCVLARPFDPACLIGPLRRLRLDLLMETGSAEAVGKVLRFADLEMNIAAARVRRNGQEIPLTALQFRLLRYLLQNPRIVRSREELIAAAWPADADVEPRTVDIHMGHIRRALGRLGPDLIRTVRRHGYALDLGFDPKSSGH